MAKVTTRSAIATLEYNHDVKNLVFHELHSLSHHLPVT